MFSEWAPLLPNIVSSGRQSPRCRWVKLSGGVITTSIYVIEDECSRISDV